MPPTPPAPPASETPTRVPRWVEEFETFLAPQFQVGSAADLRANAQAWAESDPAWRSYTMAYLAALQVRALSGISRRLAVIHNSLDALPVIAAQGDVTNRMMDQVIKELTALGLDEAVEAPAHAPRVPADVAEVSPAPAAARPQAARRPPAKRGGTPPAGSAGAPAVSNEGGMAGKAGKAS